MWDSGGAPRRGDRGSKHETSNDPESTMVAPVFIGRICLYDYTDIIKPIRSLCFPAWSLISEPHPTLWQNRLESYASSPCPERWAASDSMVKPFRILRLLAMS